MDLYLNESPARGRFKAMLGHANHLIITGLVGLDAIERGVVTDAPADLHAVWSPRNPVASARRSRRLLLDMAMVRSVDALDAYMGLSRRKPHLIQDADLWKAFDHPESKVTVRFRAMVKRYEGVDPVLVALMEVLIAWRNRSVHSLSDTDVAAAVWDVLREAAGQIEADFSGLEIDRLRTGFLGGEPATFRETASLIHATQKVVEALEREQLKVLDGTQFLRELIWTSMDCSGSAEVADKHRRKRIGSVWGRDPSERPSKVRSLLLNFGLSPTAKYDYSVVFDANVLERLGRMSPTEAYAFLRDG